MLPLIFICKIFEIRTQMYKVFYNSTGLFIGEKPLTGTGRITDVEVKNKTELFRFLHDFLSGDLHTDASLKGYATGEMFADLRSFFSYMEAAGGLVKNVLDKYLFILRFGIWDLPKGKLEKNENPAQAALREVEEETGITGLSITEELHPTYHIYPLVQKYILKKTHWFAMFTESHEQPVPQQVESITRAVWLDKAKSMEAIGSSYRSLQENFLSFFSH